MRWPHHAVACHKEPPGDRCHSPSGPSAPSHRHHRRCAANAVRPAVVVALRHAFRANLDHVARRACSRPKAAARPLTTTLTSAVNAIATARPTTVNAGRSSIESSLPRKSESARIVAQCHCRVENTSVPRASFAMHRRREPVVSGVNRIQSGRQRPMRAHPMYSLLPPPPPRPSHDPAAGGPLGLEICHRTVGACFDNDQEMLLAHCHDHQRGRNAKQRPADHLAKSAVQGWERI